MLIMPQLMVSLKRSDVEAMIRGLDRMSWRLVRALEARDLRGAGGEEEECFEEDASQEEECFEAKEAEEEDASQDRKKRSQEALDHGHQEEEDNEEEDHGEAEEALRLRIIEQRSGGKKGTGKSKGKPRSRSRSRNRHPPAQPCYYKKRYEGEGCALWAVMKIWMRGKSARPKERFCCRACGEWLTSEGEDGAAPLADLHGDL
jgi:hypothetical protein